jgi:hypothetical protein
MSNQFRLNAQERKIVGLAALGGMLEFYDFIIYGLMLRSKRQTFKFGELQFKFL